jgi:uncharacterized phage protein (TIGR01671 family)
MREIKFRAWDKEKKQMTPSFNLWSLTEDENFNLCLDGYGILYPNRVILMQYTGLHDKNGKEIYEGDIVSEWFYPDFGIEKTRFEGIVEWFDSGWFVKTKNVGEISLTDTAEIEIIGNIYENPESLKETKDD